MTELKNHSAHQIGLGKCFNANTKPDKDTSESTEETHACINVIKINYSNEPIEVHNDQASMFPKIWATRSPVPPKYWRTGIVPEFLKSFWEQGTVPQVPQK